MATYMTIMATGNDELKCGICLELFQDPRSLPCLHTFCRECIQRSLNETDHSLKCPLCRSKYELSDEGAGLLPVNQYALQELPLKRLQQQQREDNGGQQAECKSCGEQAPVVAWCVDCDAMICQQCLSQHQKMASLRKHRVFKSKESELPDVSLKGKSKPKLISYCPRHLWIQLKYWCTRCSELVCSECLLFDHKDHQFSLVEEARHSIETKMEELASLVQNKKEEFTEFLVKVGKAECEALEYSELMKSEVNNVFDGIVASVEAQRNEALQSVSQEVKEIWAQKEMVEVSLAQLDRFTQFADHTHKCTTDTSYIAMAAQGIKLMERLKDTHGDESSLELKRMVIGSQSNTKPLHVPLDGLFSLCHPSLKFSPAPGSKVISTCNYNKPLQFKVQVKVSLEVGGISFPELFPPLHENCKLAVTALYNFATISTEVELGQSSWTIFVSVSETGYHSLIIRCKVLGAVTLESKVKYRV